MKFIRSIRLFFDYRRNILKNRLYLSEKFGLEISWIYEMYTTLTLADAPEDMKQKYGSALAEFEIKKYITAVNSNLAKLGLEELVNVYEIKRLNKDEYGIAFGYALFNNTRLILLFLGTILTVLGSIITLIII